MRSLSLSCVHDLSHRLIPRNLPGADADCPQPAGGPGWGQTGPFVFPVLRHSLIMLQIYAPETKSFLHS